ncbi:outer membrane beta-barrel protein [Bizionia arctica]|uniref:PorT family protein n=1 Tax=Bizionia arctica TaxID=1495645 RepID=A0A917GAT9_9FLAO|nr:outer membrane beta-barrel protein [Bizionia arctica]GGG34828.1 hypothetical protein GCM10010976_03110 [Bizionia arctica]
MLTLKNNLILKRGQFLVIAILFSTITYAQNNESSDDNAKSSIKISAGVNFNSLNVDSKDQINTDMGMGYNLGVSYYRGSFFYFEVGARYNDRNFDINDTSTAVENNSSLKLSAIDVPITGGINLTSFAEKLIGLRLFVSAVPSFTINKNAGSNSGFQDDDLTSFMFYGQGGVGVDIAFFFVEAGYNYGFSNLIDDTNNQSTKSNPSQAYVNIGFRF